MRNPAVLRKQVTPIQHVLYPLNEFYEEAGLPSPPAIQIEGREMPEPYRGLLVHDRDMTPTLEAAYQQKIHLRVLKYWERDHVFSRQVLLVTDDESAVEYGGIKIYLEHFPDEARRLILEREQPLGTILRTQGITHASRPAAYLQVTADAAISQVLGLTGPATLYGRRNVLFDPSQRILAQVVEILPPARGTVTGSQSV